MSQISQMNFESNKTIRKSIHAKKSKKNTSTEDAQIINALKNLEVDLDSAHNKFNYATDPLLIDSYSYEIMSLHKKYQFFLKECKNRGLHAEVL